MPYLGVVFDHSIQEELLGLKGMQPGEGVQADWGLLKLDDKETLLSLEGLQVSRQLRGSQDTQLELTGVQLERLKEVALGCLLSTYGPGGGDQEKGLRFETIDMDYGSHIWAGALSCHLALLEFKGTQSI